MDNGSALDREDLLHLMSLKEVLDAFVHEIRQPLNVIMLACQVIRLRMEQTPLAEDVSGFLIQRSDLIASQVRRATETVKSVSTFSRPSGSDEAQADVAAVFRKVNNLMGQQFSSREIQLRWDFGHGPLLVAVPSHIVEAVIIQSLAFARDTVQAIGAWHRGQDFSYLQSVTATLVNEGGEAGLRLGWNAGQLSNGAFLIDPRTHPGLLVTSSVLSNWGGDLSAATDSLSVTFSG